MNFLDLTLPSVAENLALDEALLLECEAGTGQEVLRLWEWPRPAVVLGAAGVLAWAVREGTIASKRGSATAAPTPRRKVRLDSAFLVTIIATSSSERGCWW